MAQIPLLFLYLFPVVFLLQSSVKCAMVRVIPMCGRICYNLSFYEILNQNRFVQVRAGFGRGPVL